MKTLYRSWLALLGCCWLDFAAAEEAAQFSADALRRRGIDPAIAEYFRQGPTFTPGLHRVDLAVNGQARGAVDARFDAQGQLCLDADFLEAAQLRAPKAADADRCRGFIASYPTTEVRLRPNRQEVELLVSTDALRPLLEAGGEYDQGGAGAMLNYDWVSLHNRQGDTRSNLQMLNAELGLNVDNWVLRSRQSYSVQAGSRNFQTLHTYAQRTFERQAAVVQFGEINLSNSVFAGTALSGVQWLPEEALNGAGNAYVPVEGIALSPSRVEIRQNGLLIHTALVPSGPFSLPGISALDRNSDLQVQVIENSGGEQSFTVPAARLASLGQAAPGLAVALGQVRDNAATGLPQPWLASASAGTRWGDGGTLSGGLMLADNSYFGLGASLGAARPAGLGYNLRTLLSHDGRAGVSGALASTGVSFSLGGASLGANASVQSAGQRNIEDTQHAGQNPPNRALRQFSLYGGWHSQAWGSFGTSFSTTHSASAARSRRLTASWSRNFGDLALSANLEHALDPPVQDDSPWGTPNPTSRRQDTAFYLSASLPLGQGRLRSYASSRDASTRLGTSFNGQAGDTLGYNLSTEQQSRQERRIAAEASLLTPYSQVNLGHWRQGGEREGYSGQLRGGLALHGGGLAFSPYALSDTYAVAKVGSFSGVQLETPSGPVWTDPWGQALIPRVNPYQPTRLQVATQTLPRNVDVANSLAAINLGRGTIKTVNFNARSVRRLLLQVEGPAGPLARGLSVVDGDGNYLTSVLDASKVLLDRDYPDAELRIRLEDERTCALQFSPAASADPHSYFEHVPATCAVVGKETT